MKETNYNAKEALDDKKKTMECKRDLCGRKEMCFHDTQTCGNEKRPAVMPYEMRSIRMQKRPVIMPHEMRF